MKLAMITPNGTGHCMLCRWSGKAPGKRRAKRGEPTQDIPLPERQALLEKDVLAHLRLSHDRVMLTRDVAVLGIDGQMDKVYYLGRAPQRGV